VALRLELDVTFAARRPWAPRRADFARWAGAALADGAARALVRRGGNPRGGNPRVAMSVRVVGAARSRSLNAHYRRRDRATNVLSFGGAGAMPDGSVDLGELVICAPVVAREASAQGKAAAAHWAHLTVHGVLHLLGFDHERRGEALEMERRETQILDRLGFSNPYAWPAA
jgi:probable rRNA maturation factor